MSEKWRQKLHLEPPCGWLNDPNGLCYFKDRYHVFFQYSPQSPEGGGKKCWGHYESPDLLKWKFVGTALFPDTPDDKDGVYSGSAVVADGKMEIFYTGNVKESGVHDYIKSGRGANVIRVTSEDGHNFSPKKTVLRNSGYPGYCSCHVRDPKVWKENGKYFMVLGARTLLDEGCVLIYDSENLEKWQFKEKLSVPDFGYMWECPDIFEIGTQRLLSVSPQGLSHTETAFQNVYSSGYFRMDGTLHDFEEWDHGFDFYAPQSFSAPDGRRIIIGWMGIGDIPYKNPTVPLGWQHCLTLPREVTVSDGDVIQKPIEELLQLRDYECDVSDGENCSLKLPFDITGNVDGKFKIKLNNAVVLSYDGRIFRLEFTDERTGCGRNVRRCIIESCGDIRIIADMSSLEIYLGGGRRVMSTRFYPEGTEVSLQTSGIRLKGYHLRGMEAETLGE